VKHFGIDVARNALERWRGAPETLEHVATSGNDVYRFRAGGEPRILRITDRAYRTFPAQHAEMAFLRHLEDRGVRVAAPIPSKRGQLLETFDDHSACVLSWAPGVRVDPGSPDWDLPFFRAWGRSLAAIHRAAQSYRGPDRWEWWEEGLIADADRLIPESAEDIRADLALVIAHLRALPRDRETYGMTHADFGPQNFHYDRVRGITSFDFGNCCHHWFISDLVISLSTLRRQPDRDRLRDEILDGYRETLALPEIWAERRWLLRLRVHYVYLSRLEAFGSRPTPEQSQTLATLREWVRAPIDWP
jgi:Ser/Thr protein kinase RdoA (MazF antagonist)